MSAALLTSTSSVEDCLLRLQAVQSFERLIFDGLHSIESALRGDFSALKRYFAYKVHNFGKGPRLSVSPQHNDLQTRIVTSKHQLQKQNTTIDQNTEIDQQHAGQGLLLTERRARYKGQPPSQLPVRALQ